MFDLNLDILALLFGAFNILRLISYFHQIVVLAHDDTGARAISLSCWSIWVGANASTSLYAWIRAGDLTLAAVSGFNAICCLIVLGLAISKRLARQIVQESDVARLSR
jgi:hypothetical protein